MKRNCEGCCFYGRVADAPETVKKDCLYFLDSDYDDEGIELTPPCDREDCAE